MAGALRCELDTLIVALRPAGCKRAMLDSEFWQNLAHEFLAIHDPDGRITAYWKRKRGRDEPFEWSVRPNKQVWGAESAQAQFDVLAARGGAKLENPKRRDL